MCVFSNTLFESIILGVCTCTYVYFEIVNIHKLPQTCIKDTQVQASRVLHRGGERSLDAAMKVSRRHDALKLTDYHLRALFIFGEHTVSTHASFIYIYIGCRGMHYGFWDARGGDKTAVVCI